MRKSIKAVVAGSVAAARCGHFNSALWKGLPNVYSTYDPTIICDTGCAGATVHIWN